MHAVYLIRDHTPGTVLYVGSTRWPDMALTVHPSIASRADLIVEIMSFHPGAASAAIAVAEIVADRKPIVNSLPGFRAPRTGLPVRVERRDERIFASIAEAAEATGVHKADLCALLNGRKNLTTLKGFRFRKVS